VAAQLLASRVVFSSTELVTEGSDRYIGTPLEFAGRYGGKPGGTSSRMQVMNVTAVAGLPRKCLYSMNNTCVYVRSGEGFFRPLYCDLHDILCFSNTIVRVCWFPGFYVGLCKGTVCGLVTQCSPEKANRLHYQEALYLQYE
jgi:hypothetical protein